MRYQTGAVFYVNFSESETFAGEALGLGEISFLILLSSVYSGLRELVIFPNTIDFMATEMNYKTFL